MVDSAYDFMIAGIEEYDRYVGWCDQEGLDPEDAASEQAWQKACEQAAEDAAAERAEERLMHPSM